MDGQNFQNDMYNQPVYTQPVAPQQPKTPTTAIVSLVMGILSLLLACCYGIGIVFAIVGIILAILSFKQSKSGVGIAGLVCSIIGAVFSAIMLVYFAFVIKVMIDDPSIMDDILSNFGNL